jgi:hypothetical protein
MSNPNIPPCEGPGHWSTPVLSNNDLFDMISLLELCIDPPSVRWRKWQGDGHPCQTPLSPHVARGETFLDVWGFADLFDRKCLNKTLHTYLKQRFLFTKRVHAQLPEVLSYDTKSTGQDTFKTHVRNVQTLNQLSCKKRF